MANKPPNGYSTSLSSSSTSSHNNHGDSGSNKRRSTMMMRNRPSLSSSSSSSSKNRASRIILARFLLIFSLFSAGAICASVAYVSLNNTEENAFAKTYESIAISALEGAKAITVRKLQSSQVMATMLSHTFPDASQWPFISMDGYIPIANKVAQLSSSFVQSMTVLIEPDQAPAFEEHAKQVFEDQQRPEGAGHSDFGFGIWKPDRANSPYGDGRSHDTTGITPWETSRSAEIMTPLLMHNQPNASALMYNLYSEQNRGAQINSIMDCVDEYKLLSELEEQDDNETSVVQARKAPKEPPACGVITDVLELKVRKGPAALVFEPILPANDPTTFVAFATTSIVWEDVLKSIVPSFVNGLICVIDTETTTFTFEIQNGAPQWVGEGDLHDPKYSKFARSELLTAGIETGSETSAVYRLTVYPTRDMVEVFSTSSPIKVALGFLAAIAFCTLCFLLYDFLMRSQANERSVILETKRRFVRFISHEIRTPLNTVCMGLELLESEMKPNERNNLSMIMDVDEEDDDLGVQKFVEEDVSFWHKVTQDMRENANVAVSILNDLLNYDKLETGTLKLELGRVDIWDLVEKTANQFQIQAVNRKVDLKLTVRKYSGPDEFQQEGSPLDESDIERPPLDEHTMVVGDDIRLSQVLRNLISNALKFTPADGTIDITAYHSKDGLSSAKPVKDDNGKAYCTHPRLGSVVIVVKDTGVGLTKEQLNDLFSEGIQFDANKLQHGGGSGLGLSIAKGIVEQHHGTVRAESDGPGHGTSFIVELPLHHFPPIHDDDDDEDNKSPPSKSSSPMNNESVTEATSSVTQNEEEKQPLTRRVLVAEDSESSRKMLVRLLQRAGHEVVPAANGQEAVDAIAADMELAKTGSDHVPIDTVLMDFEMPLLSGPEATYEIRKMGYKGIIAGVTGNVLEEDMDYFISKGANEVLPKPINMQRLNNYWEAQVKPRRHRGRPPSSRGLSPGPSLVHA